MERERIKEIFCKYANGQCSEEEKAWIETWYNQYQADSATDLSEADLEYDLQKVFEALPKPKVKAMSLWFSGAAAAVVLISLFVGFYSYFEKNVEFKALVQSPNPKKALDLPPGDNKAILTLADGSTIALNDAKSGDIAEQGGAKVCKTNDRRIIYKMPSTGQATDQASLMTYNKITVPRGGQYEVVLPDGTKVWLNAASSLKFPVMFAGNERKVELIGEAYFEVATVKRLLSSKKEGQTLGNEQGKIPFIVSTPTQSVKVLGTHFNVNAYADEPSVKTTLLEGSVKVAPQFNGQPVKNATELILEPGEQSTLIGRNKIIVTKVNTANAIAWKSGLFQFHDSDIESVMRQLSRWYDVKIEFKGEIPSIKLWGEVHRNVNASQALEILEYFNLKYRIEQTDGVRKIVIF